MKQEYPVSGMHCAACAATITKKLARVPGVKAVSVHYATETATLDVEGDVPLAKLNEPIRHLGYMLLSTDHGEMESAVPRTEIRLPVILVIVGLNLAMMIWENFFPYPAVVKTFFHHLLPVLATYMLFGVGTRYLRGIVNFLRFRDANMDTLIGIGTLVAYLYSFVVSAFEGVAERWGLPDHTYYDVTIIVIGFVMLGKYLEDRAKKQTGSALAALANLQVKSAHVVRGRRVEEVAVTAIEVGATILVKPGEAIPLDAIVLKGSSSVDESLLTGESIPADKEKGSQVYAGTINTYGVLTCRVTGTGESTVLAGIMRIVQTAQNSRAQIEHLADRVSAIFVPVVLAISLGTLIIWSLAGQPIQGLLGMIGVLVVACPCALGLATPTAMIVAMGRAARRGILVKSTESLERLATVRTLVFDKTGTLTLGEPAVTTSYLARDSSLTESVAWARFAALESQSEHPLARAIVHHAKVQKLHLPESSHIRVEAGLGIQGQVAGTNYLAGSPDYLQGNGLKLDHEILARLKVAGTTPLVFASQNEVHLYVGVQDTLHPNSAAALRAARALGLRTVMLTGDREHIAHAFADQLGIDEVIAEVLPATKAQVVRDIEARGTPVAMVGDGVNDAPALASATVGIALGTGTDIARHSAHITILGGGIARVPEAVKLARATMRVVRENLFWAFIYNLLGIPLAAGALLPFWGVSLNPAFAGAAMAGSSLSVVANSLRLKIAKI
jgi:Cu2+-exporting ATPase/Cu+-exporting ATPase